MTVAAPNVEEILESMVVGEVLEALAARLAAQSLSEETAMRLKALHHELGKTLEAEDAERAVELSSQIHRTIWKACGNARLLAILDQLEVSRGGRLRRSAYGEPNRVSQAHEEHSQLITAMVDRDPDRAEAAMRSHLKAAREVRILMSVREAEA